LDFLLLSLLSEPATVGLTESIQSEGLNVISLLIQVFIVILGLVFSALFSSAEVAFFSLSGNLSREQKAEYANDKPLKRVLYMLDSPRRLLATILIGNTVANIVTAVLAAVITGQLLFLTDIPDAIVYAIEVVVITFIIVILAEITPKILALKNDMKVARILSGIIYFFFVFLAPIAKILAQSAIFLEKKLPKPSDNFSAEDLRTIAEVGELQGSLQGDEREIIENVIEFGNTTVREIMTSRVNIVAISTEDSFEEVLEVIREKSVSRMPLYDETLDNIIGVIYTKDLLQFLDLEAPDYVINWKSLARRALFIPPSKKLDDLLRDFQSEKTHLAIVVDEYGGTEGIVSLDDVLEEIVGEIHDEYSGHETLYTRRKNGDYIFDAKIDLDDMGDILSIELAEDNDEYETLGGLIYHLLERIPEVGEKVVFKGLELTVHKVDNNRVTKVSVNPDVIDAERQIESDKS
jgi:gliding motility-associated protein GldE